MKTRAMQLMVWGGGAGIALAAVLAVALNLALGEKVFAARLLAGLTGCL